MPEPAVLAQPDTELREPSHNSEDQVSGSDTVLGTHKRELAYRRVAWDRLTAPEAAVYLEKTRKVIEEGS